MRRNRFACLDRTLGCLELVLAGFLVAGVGLGVHAEDASQERLRALGQQFDAEIRPLLEAFCLGCHSTEKKEGELDLERFRDLSALRADAAVWQKVREFVLDGEMPPAEARQPVTGERRTLLRWVESFLEAEADFRAGDPGPVVLRRLSNAEYTYTVRDLTGLDDLDPAREFPIDGAAGEGFTNAGEALVMSPALVSKYLEAGKRIAEHAVLLPDGIRFFAGRTRPDWSNDLLAQIQGFYDVYTRGEVSQGGLARWRDSNAARRAGYEDGRVDLTPFLSALFRRRADVQEGTRPLRDLAREEQVSARYFERIARWFRDSGPQSLLARRFRRVWLEGDVESAPALAREIRGWQDALWQFNTVGHLGLIRPWQVPASPVRATHQLEHPIGEREGGIVTVHLVARPLGDGQGVIEWTRPRLEQKDQPTLLLRSVPGAALVFPGESTALPARDLAESHVLRAPSVIEVRLPAEQASGYTLVVDARLADFSDDAAIEVDLTGKRPAPDEPPAGRRILAREEGDSARTLEESFRDFRDVFPSSMCYARIVPVDEVVTVVVYHREDDQMVRLMLDDAERLTLDRLWEELRFVSRDAFQLVASLEHELEYATQDADPARFRPLQGPIDRLADGLRRQLRASEPAHVDALLEFAARAYRRPLTNVERHGLLALYHSLRSQEISHEESIRLTLARVFASPAFLYRVETPPAGPAAAPVTDWELATRLSYFLWSSVPDGELRRVASAGGLGDTETLLAQTRRMLRDEKAQRLAAEFACQWLNVYAFDTFDEKSEAAFPEFASLRGPMHEEVIRFFADLFRANRSVLDMLDADHTFVNERLAAHYGIDGVEGAAWRRVSGLDDQERGGILGFGATLSRQSGASRTSPILRGNWIFESLLGQHLPRPPPDVPQLPATAPEGLTERQLIERHSSDPACAKCHEKIDSYGFALEGFDAIGRFRQEDAAGLPVVTSARLPDGAEVDGLAGLRKYLLTTKRDAFVRQFCRKLLGYALGRGVQLSDEPLLERMYERLATADWRFHAAVETIVESRQFREIRGAEFE